LTDHPSPALPDLVEVEELCGVAEEGAGVEMPADLRVDLVRGGLRDVECESRMTTCDAVFRFSTTIR
jgi:hypothetical protein